MIDHTDPDWLEYFSGGVPTGEYFRMTIGDLNKTIDHTTRSGRINELCFIGLISYFEAFCKDHFASILNIEPSLLVSLRKNGHDIQLDPSRLLDFCENWMIRLGFIVTEKFDFGSAQKINALYGSLLKISPFSKDDAKYYESILRDRNLLVHHGGIVTLTYFSQNKFLPGNSDPRPYFDSLIVTPEYFKERVDFIKIIARKILKASYAALHSYVLSSQLNYQPERAKAMDALLWWGDGEEY